MNGKLVGVIIVVSALVAGAALYYLQIYAFYEEVASVEGADVQLVARETNEPEPIPYAEFAAIDADSSPIRYRACFITPMGLDRLTEDFLPVMDATPRNAPGWFECFDASAIAAELEAGTARAYLGQKNIAYGVDRIVAVTADGRGFVWHELNECGDKTYDGTVVGEECPPATEAD